MSKSKSQPVVVKPGQSVPKSGQYELVGPRGGKTGEEYTFVKNHTVAPTKESGQKFILVDKTK